MHAFQKKSKRGVETPKSEYDFIRSRLKKLREKEEEIELVRGSDNIFRDFGHPDADILLAKANLAADIIGALNKKNLKGKKAAETLKLNEADVSRIRNADLERFTIDRLVNALNNLGLHVELEVSEAP